MLFNSISFLIFLPVVFSLYWMLSRHRYAQNVLLLAASYVFYGWWDWRYLFLIFGCSLVNYVAGNVIFRSQRRFVRIGALVVCCFVCLGALGVFKYYNFFVQSFAALFECVGIHWSPMVLKVMLPVGISFFTFQALSYTIDILFGKLKPAENWVEFFVFISFFPQLVAGPIERATNLLPQFQQVRRFDFDAATQGCSLIAYGLFKKMCVADLLALYVDAVYSRPLICSSVSAIIAMVFFSIQIYCDFSGYSDVARGVARLFGFELMLNFNRPYLAKTFSEFWRRWHISLSTWFKDYVYIPLGGSRVSMGKIIRNLWIVFLLSGLWHGAAWTFVAWGALHALFLTVGVLKKRYCPWLDLKTRIGQVLSGLFVYCGVCLAWVLFRANDLPTLKRFCGLLFGGDFSCAPMALFAGIGPLMFGSCLLAIGLLALSYLLPLDCRVQSLRGRFAFVAGCIAALVFFGMPSGGEFIYFRF